MGFYGNITNTSRTQFQFDKIYPSRAEMDAGTYIDGIYAGRYVLIEYDSNTHQDSFYRAYIDNKTGQMYNAPNAIGVEENILYVGKNDNSSNNRLSIGTIFFTADIDEASKYINTIYYQVTGGLSTTDLLVEGNYKQITSDKTLLPDGTESTVSNYVKNYAIDNEKYGAGRGYDSTVWQKIYIDNAEKYIMIAELNSVVPTFDVSADAPSVEPITPHFDTQSTDLYYKLHWQPTWGMRIAEGKLPDAEESGGITSSKDPNSGKYPSDEDVSYSKLKYNPVTKEVEEDKQQPEVRYKGAIYYNKAGFEDYKHTYYNGSFKEDKISVQPLGISGTLYNEHGDSIGVSEQPDIQEISIMLPSLGNALCDIWDKIYGYNPENENLRYRDIEWKDAILESENSELKKFDGLASPKRDPKWEKIELGGKSYDLETIAGCINLTHDLLGMILTTKDLAATEETYALNKIFLRSDKKYYRVHKFPIYDDINTSSVTGLNPDDYTSDQEYNKAFENAVNEIIKDRENEDWYLIMNDSQSANSNRIVKRFNKKALTATALNGHKLAVQGKDANGKLKYGYEFVELKGFANDLSTINGLILELRSLIESDDSETRDRNTLQGSVNALNDIIDCFNDLTPGEFLICDNQGKINSANWTTEQIFGYDNLGNNSSEKESSGKENQWIELSVDESASDKQIKLIHRLVNDPGRDHTQTNTTTTSDKNDSTIGDGINKIVHKDKIELYTPIVDNAGHVVGKNTETVTLPFGYKYFTTNKLQKDEVGDIYSEEELKDPDFDEKYSENFARNTQDTLAINTGNKWIELKSPSSDKSVITIGHEVHTFKSGKANTYYGLTQNETVSSLDTDNTFEVPCFKFDEAGHITEAETHSVVLPDNFKNIKVTSSNQENSIGLSQTGTIEADTMEDTLTLAEGDRWINLAVDSKEDKITIYHNKPASATDQTHIISNNNEAEKTPKFGEKITIPEVKWDKTGHIVTKGTHDITLPLPSLNDLTATGSSVLTGISMEDSTGEITQTNAEVGTLTLTDYVKGSNANEIVAEDTINGAFSKVQVQINNIDTSLTNVNNRVTQEITDREKAINDEVAERNTAITTAIKALNVSGITNIEAGKTINSWSETEGKVSITTQDIIITNSNVANDASIDINKINIPESSLSIEQISHLNETLNNCTQLGDISGLQTIEGIEFTFKYLYDKIGELQQRISDLGG